MSSTGVDRLAPVRFLQTAYEPDDWVAILLKTYRTGDAIQRVVSVSAAMSARFQAWLRFQNAHGWNVYVSVNAVAPGRSRAKHAIAGVRHVFLEEDRDGFELAAHVATRRDLPPPSYALHSSLRRLHVFWRARGFDAATVEALQKHLANELGTDGSATSCTQTTRLPGFMNHKRARPWLVSIEYFHPAATLTPVHFPVPAPTLLRRPPDEERRVRPTSRGADSLERAKGFVGAIRPAIAGQHGDTRTFRLCCRLVRGFALSDDEALMVLSDWNAGCQPPWTERQLRAKLENARRYGREPVAGLLAKRQP